MQACQKTFSGSTLAVTSTGPGGFIVFVFVCFMSGAPEGSIGSGSGLKCPRDRVTDW